MDAITSTIGYRHSWYILLYLGIIISTENRSFYCLLYVRTLIRRVNPDHELKLAIIYRRLMSESWCRDFRASLGQFYLFKKSTRELLIDAGPGWTELKQYETGRSW